MKKQTPKQFKKALAAFGTQPSANVPPVLDEAAIRADERRKVTLEHVEKARYNGWTNYETWCVKLWMDNEQMDAAYWAACAKSSLKNAADSRARGEYDAFTVEERAVLDLSDVLKDRHEEMLPTLEGFPGDLMGAALSEVNWHEIANGLIDAAEKAVAA